MTMIAVTTAVAKTLRPGRDSSRNGSIATANCLVATLSPMRYPPTTGVAGSHQRRYAQGQEAQQQRLGKALPGDVQATAPPGPQGRDGRPSRAGARSRSARPGPGDGHRIARHDRPARIAEQARDRGADRGDRQVREAGVVDVRQVRVAARADRRSGCLLDARHVERGMDVDQDDGRPAGPPRITTPSSETRTQRWVAARRNVTSTATYRTPASPGERREQPLGGGLLRPERHEHPEHDLGAHHDEQHRLDASVAPSPRCSP